MNTLKEYVKVVIMKNELLKKEDEIFEYKCNDCDHKSNCVHCFTDHVHFFTDHDHELEQKYENKQ